MALLNRPAARVVGSVISWLLFTFCFTLLSQVSALVMGLGGSCATGGPYVIETVCPDAVVIFAPLSIFGGLAATAIALFVARGFGTPLVIWAWPILFVGLGVDFLLAALAPGGAANVVVGVVFVLMGAVPLVFVARVGVQRLLVGTTNARDRPFRDARGTTPILRFGAGVDDDRTAMPATAGDWMLALGVSLPSIALGIWLGIALMAGLAVPVAR